MKKQNEWQDQLVHKEELQPRSKDLPFMVVQDLQKRCLQQFQGPFVGGAGEKVLDKDIILP